MLSPCVALCERRHMRVWVRRLVGVQVPERACVCVCVCAK